MQRIFIVVAIIKCIKHFIEYIVGRNGIEERHARANLEGIYTAKYILHLLATVLQQGSSDFAQSGTKNRMTKISHSLVESADAVILGIGTATQYCQLRKDKPYPVRPFASVDDYLQGKAVVEILRG